MEKSGPPERAQLANQIQGFRIPDRADAWENNNSWYFVPAETAVIYPWGLCKGARQSELRSWHIIEGWEIRIKLKIPSKYIAVKNTISETLDLKCFWGGCPSTPLQTCAETARFPWSSWITLKNPLVSCTAFDQFVILQIIQMFQNQDELKNLLWKDQSSFEYLQTNRVRIGGKD